MCDLSILRGRLAKAKILKTIITKKNLVFDFRYHYKSSIIKQLIKQSCLSVNWSVFCKKTIILALVSKNQTFQKSWEESCWATFFYRNVAVSFLQKVKDHVSVCVCVCCCGFFPFPLCLHCFSMFCSSAVYKVDGLCELRGGLTVQRTLIDGLLCNWTWLDQTG